MWSPESVTTVVVAPAAPERVTSLSVKPVTGLLNTAVKLMGLVLVGSACPVAWLMVTVGDVTSALGKMSYE